MGLDVHDPAEPRNGIVMSDCRGVATSRRASTKPSTWEYVRHMTEPHRYAALGIEPIRTIGRDELKAKLDHGESIKLVMALNRWAYDAKHIPGSLHFDTPDALYAVLRPGDEIVVYCSQNDCLSSVAVYRDLVARGYRNVRRYSGGLMDWEDAGLALEGTSVARTAS
jgi:rhodanese-related sulfurtransferase